MANDNPPAVVEDVQLLNRQMLGEIDKASDGDVKYASAAGTNMIRRRIREDGFLRRIIPPQTATNEMLDRVLEHDRPVIIEDMEPETRGAKTIPFGDSADVEFYYGNKFANVFFEVTTPEFVKDINELRTYKMDLRRVVTDNALKQMQDEEDGKFIAEIDDIVGAVNGTGEAGYAQNFEIAGGLVRENYVDILSYLEDHNLNNGVFLMNRKTGKQFLKWTRDEIGGDLAQDTFKQGLSALSEATIMGVKHIFTIKRDLVPDNVVYIFGEPNFFGRMYELQATTMYVEKKKNFLKFQARETISVSLPNVAACAKAKFI